MSTTLIPFQIETERVIQLLAKQIYQSPLALLRENTQNAFDAIRQRLHKDINFEPRIDINLTPELVVISDNGLGMTSQDLEQHYWRAGSSSKNNEEARAAGVVGIFGIGAMANFGIADRLTVETESAIPGCSSETPRRFQVEGRQIHGRSNVAERAPRKVWHPLRARVMLRGVDRDERLEPYWTERQQSKLAESLSGLGISAIVSDNSSV